MSKELKGKEIIMDTNTEAIAPIEITPEERKVLEEANVIQQKIRNNETSIKDQMDKSLKDIYNIDADESFESFNECYAEMADANNKISTTIDAIEYIKNKKFSYNQLLLMVVVAFSSNNKYKNDVNILMQELQLMRDKYSPNKE